MVLPVKALTELLPCLELVNIQLMCEDKILPSIKEPIYCKGELDVVT